MARSNERVNKHVDYFEKPLFSTAENHSLSRSTKRKRKWIGENWGGQAIEEAALNAGDTSIKRGGSWLNERLDESFTSP